MGLEHGYIQVYTGAGKGKTTAALGLALRALGAGLRVYIVHFLKSCPTSEHHALELFGDSITVRFAGHEGFILSTPTAEDIEVARTGLTDARSALESGEYDVVILDEANTAVTVGVLDIGDILTAIDIKAAHTELILTGQNAPDEIIDRADLVTEMREVRHYFSRGVSARHGIEK